MSWKTFVMAITLLAVGAAATPLVSSDAHAYRQNWRRVPSKPPIKIRPILEPFKRPTMSEFIERCPTETAMAQLDAADIAVADGFFGHFVALAVSEDPDSTFPLDPFEQLFQNIVAECDEAVTDPTDPDHWVHSKNVRTIALAKALELSMMPGPSFQVRVGNPEMGPAPWKTFSTVFEFLESTGVKMIVLHQINDEPAQCCVGGVELSGGTVVANAMAFFPQFGIPIDHLVAHYTNPDVDPDNRTIMTGSSYEISWLLDLMGFEPSVDYDPAYAFNSKKLFKEVTEDESSYVPFSADWFVQLYGTLAHEMSHRVVGAHTCNFSQDTRLSEGGAFHVHYRVLARLLAAQNVLTPKYIGLIPALEYLASHPKLNDVEEMSVIRVMQKMAEGAVCEPEPYEESGPASVYLYTYEEDYPPTCQDKVSEWAWVQLEWNDSEFPRCWADVSPTW